MYSSVTTLNSFVTVPNQCPPGNASAGGGGGGGGDTGSGGDELPEPPPQPLKTTAMQATNKPLDAFIFATPYEHVPAGRTRPWNRHHYDAAIGATGA
jgi:hypothetical protein